MKGNLGFKMDVLGMCFEKETKTETNNAETKREQEPCSNTEKASSFC